MADLLGNAARSHPGLRDSMTGVWARPGIPALPDPPAFVGDLEGPGAVLPRRDIALSGLPLAPFTAFGSRQPGTGPRQFGIATREKTPA